LAGEGRVNSVLVEEVKSFTGRHGVPGGLLEKLGESVLKSFFCRVAVKIDVYSELGRGDGWSEEG
jgi:hypothetical protein